MTQDDETLRLIDPRSPEVDYFLLSISNFEIFTYEKYKNDYLLSDIYRIHAFKKVDMLSQVPIKK